MFRQLKDVVAWAIDEFKSLRTRCPICGSSNLNEVTRISFISPYGADQCAYCSTEHLCLACGAEGCFDNSNDPKIEEAITKAISRRSIKSVASLEAKGYKRAYIERCTGLRIGHLARCEKASKFSVEMYALLRLIECQPELLTVAKNNYSDDMKILVLEGNS
jgi:hypothetical protein